MLSLSRTLDVNVLLFCLFWFSFRIWSVLVINYIVLYFNVKLWNMFMTLWTKLFAEMNLFTEPNPFIFHLRTSFSFCKWWSCFVTSSHCAENSCVSRIWVDSSGIEITGSLINVRQLLYCWHQHQNLSWKKNPRRLQFLIFLPVFSDQVGFAQKLKISRRQKIRLEENECITYFKILCFLKNWTQQLLLTCSKQQKLKLPGAKA